MRLECTGSFSKTLSFLHRAKDVRTEAVLHKYGKEGVRILQSATPKRSGKTASSWSYEIEKNGKDYAIYWNNSNVNKGVNIALIIQLGHGTRNGGYVQGVDYINPAMVPVFEKITNDIWKEVTG